jgi:hypothetical protein
VVRSEGVDWSEAAVTVVGTVVVAGGMVVVLAATRLPAGRGSVAVGRGVVVVVGGLSADDGTVVGAVPLGAELWRAVRPAPTREVSDAWV